MRQPRPLATANEGAGERMLCILANIFYIFGDLDAPDTEAIRDRLSREQLYHTAGELLPVIFLLRESNLQVYAVGDTNIRGRMEQWLGTETMKWFGHRLTETPRCPTVSDIDTLLDEGCAIIVPAASTLIVGTELPVTYSPAKGGDMTLYASSSFQGYEHHSIIAVHSG